MVGGPSKAPVSMRSMPAAARPSTGSGLILKPCLFKTSEDVGRPPQVYRRPWMVLGLMPDFLAARRAEISCISLPMLD
jgi:hypothetical protein